MSRALIACAALILVGAHYSGNMKPLVAMLDIGIEPQHWLYAAALPFTCVAAFWILRD